MDCSPARTRDPAEWMETCPEFSWAIARQIREWFLTWEPDLTESIKWNMLCFSGRKLVCGLSACQRHLGITFFRGTEIRDETPLFTRGEGNTNIRSIRMTSLEAVDPAELRLILSRAVQLDSDATLPPLPRSKRTPWPVPEFFRIALKRKNNRRAADFFESLKPTYQREYLVWLSMAKLPETRMRRLNETVAALKAGRKWAQRKGTRSG